MTQSNAYLYNMPSGIPGAINRVGGNSQTDIETVIQDPNHVFPAYGLAGQIDATTGLFRPVNAADTAAYGILVRPFPTQATTASGYSGQSQLGTAAVPPTSGNVACLKAGYMTVLLQANNAGVVTQPVKGGTVYVCIQNPPAGGVIGGFLGAADGGNTIALNANTYFMGPSDSNNNIEIGYNI